MMPKIDEIVDSLNNFHVDTEEPYFNIDKKRKDLVKLMKDDAY